MYNENKVRQVFNAIKDNRLEAMDDESLAKLLSILSPSELDAFEAKAFRELGGDYALKRILNIRPLVQYTIDKDLFRIKNSTHYNVYLESLSNGRYLELFPTLSIEELGDLKKYIYYNVDGNNPDMKSGADKIIRMITKEIAKRDTIKKPHFN